MKRFSNIGLPISRGGRDIQPKLGGSWRKALRRCNLQTKTGNSGKGRLEAGKAAGDVCAVIHVRCLEVSWHTE